MDANVTEPEDGEKIGQIVQAAPTVFRRQGFHKATMQDIADEAGVGKGTTYLHFASKEYLSEHIFGVAWGLYVAGCGRDTESGTQITGQRAGGLAMGWRKTNRQDLVSQLYPKLDSPRHRWYRYRHSFSPDLVGQLIDHFGLGPQATVYDPFCGSGTTLVTCASRGVKSEGMDCLPLSVLATSVKLREYDREELLSAYSALSSFEATQSDFPEPPAPLTSYYDHEVLRGLLALGTAISELSVSPHVRDLFRLCWCGILEALSNTSKDGAFLRRVERCISPDTVSSAFRGRFEEVIEDLKAPLIEPGYVHLGDSRLDHHDLCLRPYDAVITSPPYPNRHDYTRIYGPELLMVFGMTTADVHGLRKGTLNSHVEATPAALGGIEYEEPRALESILARLEGGKGYDRRNSRMLRGYFGDMALVLTRLWDCCRAGARIALVVSDVRYAGNRVPVALILGTIAGAVGYLVEGFWLLRRRGTTPQQRKLGRAPVGSEEGVLFLVKP